MPACLRWHGRHCAGPLAGDQVLVAHRVVGDAELEGDPPSQATATPVKWIPRKRVIRRCRACLAPATEAVERQVNAYADKVDEYGHLEIKTAYYKTRNRRFQPSNLSTVPAGITVPTFPRRSRP